MQRNHNLDFHDLPKSEQARLGRNQRIELAIERAWDQFLTRGDPQNGYRFPLNKLAENICRRVGVSAEVVGNYLREVSTGDPLDPFERETVVVYGNNTLFLRPKHRKALTARLKSQSRGGDHA